MRINHKLRFVKDYELILDLGELYSELTSVNGAIKGGVTDQMLKAMFPSGVDAGFEGIEDHIYSLIAEIDKVLS